MKPFSLQGTYLLDHKKYRIRKKHLNAKFKAQYPTCSKKVTFVYLYETEKDYGFNVYTAKPKQKVAIHESIEVATDLRKVFISISAISNVNK